jgi:hypothetical protein
MKARMVGIWNKIKNGLNNVKNTVAKNLLPWMGKVGDFVNSQPFQSISSFVTPALNGFIPGLGSGISTGLNYLGKFGNIAKNMSADTMGKEFNLQNAMNTAYKFANGAYSNDASTDIPKKRVLKQGIRLARRPDQLSDRIQLKAFPDGNGWSGPIVEELD